MKSIRALRGITNWEVKMSSGEKTLKIKTNPLTKSHSLMLTVAVKSEYVVKNV